MKSFDKAENISLSDGEPLRFAEVATMDSAKFRVLEICYSAPYTFNRKHEGCFQILSY
jgi:hypothetical protein